MRHIRIIIAITFILIAKVFFAPINTAAQSVIDLAVHYVEGVPAPDEISYQVNVYLSVVDGEGIPVKDLPKDYFTIVEDSQKVEIEKLGIITDEPISIVLVLDTSGSMVGTGITDAKAAATSFISGLKPNDQVAIMVFDNNIRTQIDFTADRKALTDRIALIDATRDSGTCLYDAAFSAVQMASTIRSGSRAVILFTDGIDETPSGAICSTHTADDVITIAKEHATRTPVYTLGMGKQINDQDLKRIATLTGGLYLHSPSSSQLANAFQLLSDQLRSQYILTYKSLSAPGPHNIIVSVNQLGVEDRDTRNFLLPPLPTRIVFVTPLEGETASNVIKVAVSLLSQGEIVQRVAIEVNGTEVDSDDTKPYEFDLDVKQYPIGVLVITAIAYGENNAELARSSLNIIHSEIVEAPTVIVSTEIPPTAMVAPVPEPEKPKAVTRILLGGLGIIIIAALLFVILRQQKLSKERDEEDEFDSGALAAMQGIPVYSKKNAARPASRLKIESDALGELVIEASDDSSLVGHHFEITTSSVTLGRSADNDLNFPNDKPVSRHHAEIYQSNGKLYLRVVETTDASGKIQAPKYGTFINQLPIGSDPVLLKTGDEIQLGKRVRLKFEAYAKADDEDARTYDDMDSSEDLDRTQDQ